MGGPQTEMETCCLVIPLKFGVALISMIVFGQSLVSILALLTGDINFQGNGYSSTFYHLPSIVGSLGIGFAFIGLLGIYDEKPSWVRLLNRYQAVKLLSMLVAATADFFALRKCDGWLESPERAEAKRLGFGELTSISDRAIEALAEQHVCPWARTAYVIGFVVDFGLCAYFAYKCVLYEQQLLTRPHPIDFSSERFGVAGRWRLYGVKDPRIDERHPSKADMEDDEEEPLDFSSSRFGGAAPMSYGSTKSGSAIGGRGGGPDEGSPADSEATLLQSMDSRFDDDPSQTRRAGARDLVGASVAAAGGGLGGGLPAPSRGASQSAVIRSAPATGGGGRFGSLPAASPLRPYSG